MVTTARGKLGWHSSEWRLATIYTVRGSNLKTEGHGMMGAGERRRQIQTSPRQPCAVAKQTVRDSNGDMSPNIEPRMNAKNPTHATKIPNTLACM